jgi:succinoglycan biosynthesis protein ExoA
MQPMLSLSVVVPCRNERDTIEACVRSIFAQELAHGGFELVIADGMSDDGTREILDSLSREYANLRVIDNPSQIVSTGLNAAIGVAQGDAIIRMDAHTEYASDYIRQCVAVLQETAADNVGGPWVARGKGYKSCAIAAAFQSVFAIGGARGHDPSYEGPLDTVYLGCWPREVFDRIGLFDEELVRNQDDELNLRLRRAGGVIWQSPRIKSWYTPRRSLKALGRQYCQYGYWKVRVIQKHKLPASLRHLIPGCFVILMSTLPVLALWWSWAAWAWLVLLVTYLVCSFTAAALTAARSNWRLFPLLPVIFAIYHCSYGYGFLSGILDFLILQRPPTRSSTALTRGIG